MQADANQPRPEAAGRPERLDGLSPGEIRGLASEKRRIERLSRIRQLVFGSLDGLLVPLGVISGVAGGTGDARAVIVAGVAEAFAGALSMGSGELISGRSEAQVQQTEVLKELLEIRQSPGYELREMAQIFRQEGVAAEDAGRLAGILSHYPHAYAKTMVEKELGIPLAPETVKAPEALTMAASYIAGSVFPLAPYLFLPIPAALPASFLLTFLALLAVGLMKGKLARVNLFRSVIEIVAVGALSAGGGYFLGNVVPRLLGY
ncbi:MAG: VIT1/CCC1 transporter family protein [Chloroflexota bacterium]